MKLKKKKRNIALFLLKVLVLIVNVPFEVTEQGVLSTGAVPGTARES